MERLFLTCARFAAATTCVLFAQHGHCQALKVEFGARGLEQVSYAGAVLEDTSRYPSDSFHIWHLEMTDLQGHPMPGKQFGWGEDNSGRQWDAGARCWNYTFSWGSIRLQYVVVANRLDMIVTEENHPDSGVILDGAVLYPLALHFPQLPAGFAAATYPQLSDTARSPGVIAANYGLGEVVAVTPDATRPLYSGFWPAGDSASYTAMIASTTPDHLPTFLPHLNRPVRPGQTDTFTVSLRFVPAGTEITDVAADAYFNFSRTFPSQLTWSDRRPIGAVYLASAPQDGAANQQDGLPNNPRRYFNTANAGDFDLLTSAGLQLFQKRILQQAERNVSNLRALGAQGVVTWDIEGEQYPHATTYVCSPDQIAQVAPEMESNISDPASPYRGLKLDDAYFKIMTDAGFRVGVCVRPQHFKLDANRHATQVVLNDRDALAELTRKIAFAHDRWGARLFYVDSNVDAYGGVLDPAIFSQLQRQFPDSLLIPEDSSPRYYAYSAPLKSFLFHGDLGTDNTVRASYPHAFSTILINDVSASKLAIALPHLTASVKAGDVLIGHVDYKDPNNVAIAAIVAKAGYHSPPAVTPAPTAHAVPSLHQ